MRAVLFGAGATGAYIARLLQLSCRVDHVEIRDQKPDRARRLADAVGAHFGEGVEFSDDTHTVIIATPPGSQASVAQLAVKQGISVVSTSNELAEVRNLLALDEEAQIASVPVIVGAGFMPGLTGLLARHAASELEEIDEIHVIHEICRSV